MSANNSFQIVSNEPLYKNTANSAPITGTAVNTLTESFLIDANTLTINDFLKIIVRGFKTGANNFFSVRCYINSSNSLSGAILVSLFTTTNASNTFVQTERILSIKSATETETINVSGSLVSDNTVASSRLLANIDWTINQYFIVALQNLSVSDSSVVSTILLLKY